jgi:hypothetical protein
MDKGKKVYLKGQVAVPEGSGVENFDPIKARKEVDSIMKDKDLIKVVPKFLLVNASGKKGKEKG